MSQELQVPGQLHVKKTHVYRRFWFQNLWWCLCDLFFWVAYALFASVRREDGMSLLFFADVGKKDHFNRVFVFLRGTGLPLLVWGLIWTFFQIKLLKRKASQSVGTGESFNLPEGTEMKGKEIKGHYIVEMKGKGKDNGPLWLIIALRGQSPVLCAIPLSTTLFNSLPVSSKIQNERNTKYEELEVHGQLRVRKTHVYRRFWFSKLKMACVFLLMVLVCSDFFWVAYALFASVRREDGMHLLFISGVGRKDHFNRVFLFLRGTRLPLLVWGLIWIFCQLKLLKRKASQSVGTGESFNLPEGTEMKGKKR